MTGPWTKYQQQSGGVVTKAPDRMLPFKESRERNEAVASTFSPERAEIDVARGRVGLEGDRLSNAEAAYKTEQLPVQTQYDRSSGLRKEFESLPTVKAYKEALPAVTAAFRAAKDPAGAGDLPIIYGLAKILDPGSVVREGELQLAESTGSMGQQLKGYWKSVTQGGRLPPEVRGGLLSQIRNKGSALADAYNLERRRFDQLADSAQVPDADVLGPHPALPHQQAEADFLGRPVRNLDGSTGARPSNERAPLGEGDIGFNMPADIDRGPELTPEQITAYDAFMAANPKATAEQLRAFGKSINVEIHNAADIIAFRDDPKGHGEWMSARGAKYDVPIETKRLKAQWDDAFGQAGAGDLLQHGATMGWSDNAAGVGNALTNAIFAPFSDEMAFDPLGAYKSGRDAELLRLQEARENSGWLGTGAEILGGFASGRPGAGLLTAPAPKTLGGRMWTGAKAGAGAGAVGGAGYSDGGVLETVKGAVGGGAAGGLLGGAVPVAAAGGKGLLDYARRAGGQTQGDEGLIKIADALAADDLTPSEAFANFRLSQADDVPYMLADSGDNTRGLLAAAARHPGPGKSQARSNLTQRQLSLADRVSSAIERDLGVVRNPHEVAESLMEQASRDARPHYEATYAVREVFSPLIHKLMARPAMQAALKRAERIAAEEGREPGALGVTAGRDGQLKLGTTSPSMQTLDYIKRGLDDVLEQSRDPVTGRLNLNEEGRAIETTRKAFVAELDRANPHYKTARDAWGGPVRARQAMERGLKSLTMTADDMAHVTKDMPEVDKMFFSLGVRRAMVEAVQAGGDQADAVRKLLGSGKKRAMLNHLFGDDNQGFDRFVRTMEAEAKGVETNHRAMHGSPTDLNRLESSMIEDESMGFLQRIADNQGVVATVAKEVLRLSERGAFGSGEAATNARQEIARVLSSTDAKDVGQAMKKISKLMVRERRGRRGKNGRAAIMGLGAGAGVGQTFD